MVFENGDYSAIKVILTANRGNRIKKGLTAFIEETAGVKLEKDMEQIMGEIEIGGLGVNIPKSKTTAIYRHNFKSNITIGSSGEILSYSIRKTSSSDPRRSVKIMSRYGRLLFGC